MAKIGFIIVESSLMIAALGGIIYLARTESSWFWLALIPWVGFSLMLAAIAQL